MPSSVELISNPMARVSMRRRQPEALMPDSPARNCSIWAIARSPEICRRKASRSVDQRTASRLRMPTTATEGDSPAMPRAVRAIAGSVILSPRVVTARAVLGFGRRGLASQLLRKGKEGEHVEAVIDGLSPYRHDLNLVSSLHGCSSFLSQADIRPELGDGLA